MSGESDHESVGMNSVTEGGEMDVRVKDCQNVEMAEMSAARLEATPWGEG